MYKRWVGAVKDQKGNQKADIRMGYARNEKGTIAVKSGGAFLAGYTSPEFKPRINRDLGLCKNGMAQSGMAQSSMAQSGMAQSGMAQGKIRTD